jgi:hypothetical protein
MHDEQNMQQQEKEKLWDKQDMLQLVEKDWLHDEQDRLQEEQLRLLGEQDRLHDQGGLGG